MFKRNKKLDIENKDIENKCDKSKKKKKEQALRTVKDVIPVRMYDDKLATFKNKDGSYIDVLKVIPRDIDNLSDDEMGLEIINFIKILKLLAMDIKFVSMNFPLNTRKQRDRLELFKDVINDEVRDKWIDIQRDELFRADKGILTREFYLFIFAKNEKEFIKNKENIDKYTKVGHLKLTDNISKIEKFNILRKLLNANTLQDLASDIQLDENIIKDGKDSYIDASMFSYIQPKGGFSFKEPSYISFGDGYVRCLHIYELPTYIHEFWLSKLFNIPGCICSIDIHTKNIREVKKNITKSMSEENSRFVTGKNHEEKYDAQKRHQELENLYDEISRFGEVVKSCDFRIFVSARTENELDEKCSEITNNLR